ncbi:MFS transporter [Actinoplanes sp. NPDC049596]|uniref:MFS transporter n=1 Tax=unclassified Actinoplanes TaxID=2626549 RepID=UPI003433ADA9
MANNGFRALRSVPFRWYFGGQIASASGTFLQQTAIGWLVLQLTGSASALGLVLAAGGLPSLLFGPWGGSVADRFDLRRLLIVTQAVYGALALAIWIAAATGHAGVPLVVAIGVAGGIVGIVDSPARQAFVSSLVPPDDLASAVSLNGVVMNSARVVGPALAGVLIVAVGVTPCFLVNAVSYLAVIGALLLIRPLGGPRHKPTHATGVADAVRYARTRQQVWLPLTMMALVGLFAFNFSVVLPVLAKQTFHGDGGTYGLLSTMLSVGSIAGSLGVGLVKHPRRPYLIVTALAFGAGLAATAAAPNPATATVTLLVTGAAGFAFATLASTTIQLHTAPGYRGRVVALWVFVYIGTTPIGSVLTGWLSGFGGPRLALLVGAVSCVVAAVIALRVKTPPHIDDTLLDLKPTATA